MKRTETDKSKLINYRMQRAIVGNATDPNMVKLPDEAIGITIIVKDKIEFVYYLVPV